MIINILKNAIIIKNYQIFKSNNKNIIIINNDN